MTTTIPGVNTYIKDTYFNGSDDAALDARRVLVVAPANPSTASVTPGYLQDPATNELYNPTLYKNENDVIADFGLGSPVHIAFSQVLRAGGGNIYVSATAPHSVADLKDTPTGDYAAYNQREAEVFMALENADSVLPEVVTVDGYPFNEYFAGADTSYTNLGSTDTILTVSEGGLVVDALIGKTCIVDPGGAAEEVAEIADNDATTITLTEALTGGAPDDATMVKVIDAVDRYSQVGLVLAQKCAELTEDSYPCQAVIAPVDIVTHLTANRAAGSDGSAAGVRVSTAFTDTNLTSGNINEYVNDLSDDSTLASGYNLEADWYVGVPVPLQTILDDIEGNSDADGPALSRFLIIPVGELVMQGQPADTGGSIEYTTAGPIVGGHLYKTPFNGSLTMNRIFNARFLRYKFSKSNLLALIGVKAMPINVDPGQFIATIDGITTAQDVDGEISHFATLQTLTICNEIVRGTRGIAERYIGKTADENTLNSLETQLRSYYLDRKQDGSVRQIQFMIEYLYVEKKLIVNITVVPTGEIRNIELNVGLSLNLQ